MDTAAQLAMALALLALLLDRASAQVACASVNSALGKHNTLRAQHVSTPSLAWSSTLEASATAYSATLAASGCDLVHSHGNYGENLYAAWGTSVTGIDCDAATQAWYDEISQYIYTSTPWTTNSGHFELIGHFTQVVWVSTTSVGCGRAYGTRSTQYGNLPCVVITCQYSPPGNYVGDAPFLANVQPLGITPSASPPPPPPPAGMASSPPPPWWFSSPPPPPAVTTAPPPPPPFWWPSPPPPPSPIVNPTYLYGDCADAAGMLGLHNMYRTLHGVPVLQWSNELAGTALSWSQYLTQPGFYCPNVNSYKLTPMGENIWVAAGATTSCSAAVSSWYNEIVQYSFSATPYTTNVVGGKSVAEFTQLIWRATTQVGCGIATGAFADGSPCTVVTCEYTTAGNVPATNAAYLANVPAPGSG